MGGEHEEPQHLQVILLTDVPHREKISQRLGHFLIVNIQKSVVHPVFGKRFAVCRLRLGNLILVVGKNQVLAARMNIYLLPQVLLAHHRALDMPARSSLAPGRLPERLALLLRFPEHKVQRVLLLLLPGHQKGTTAAAQIVQILVGKLAVSRKASRLKVNGAVLRHIGVSLVDQCLDHLDHAVDLAGRLGMRRCRLHMQRLHVLLALRDIALRNHGRVRALLVRFLDDLVVHVREVRHVIDVIAPVLHIAAHRVKHDHGSRVTNVNQVINRRSADVHADLSLLQGHKLLFLSR